METLNIIPTKFFCLQSINQAVMQMMAILPEFRETKNVIFCSEAEKAEFEVMYSELRDKLDWIAPIEFVSGADIFSMQEDSMKEHAMFSRDTQIEMFGKGIVPYECLKFITHCTTINTLK